MEISGLGQYNPQTGIKASKEAAQDSDFEAALKKAYNDGDKAKLKEACSQFESILLKNLYQQMKATVPKDGLTGDSNAKEIFQDMLDDELMNKSSQRGVGIADMMYRQLSEQMDKTYKAADTGSSSNDTQKAAESQASDNKVSEAAGTTPNGAETVEK